MKHKFRLGTTSFIYSQDIQPDALLTNVRQLASQVDDVELVLFDTDDYGNNFPDARTVAELNALAREHEVTYTVHLPVDLDGSDARSSEKILRAIDATRSLDSFAHVLHLDGRLLLDEPSAQTISEWQANTSRALDHIIAHIDPAQLCVENLERWSPEWFADMVAAKNLARCIDVGHLWKQGRDPLPHLQEHIARTRVIHIHGLNGHDHQSLSWQPSSQVTRVLNFLADAEFDGVMTLEVFSVDDLVSSQHVVQAWANDSH
jgi:sugar phosphate isomerase/epimerase